MAIAKGKAVSRAAINLYVHSGHREKGKQRIRFYIKEGRTSRKVGTKAFLNVGN